MFLAAASNASAKTLYLDTGGSALWEADNANKFAAWHWQGSGQGQWTSWMTRVSGNIWQTTISDASDRVIICRFNTSMSSPTWDDGNIWNKTADLTIPSDKDMYSISDWGQGTNVCPGEWMKYNAGGDPPGGGGDPVTPGDFETAVPSQCTDVMLQAFYWNSDVDNSYGTTKWTVLLSQASEISQNFQLVWLAPSCNSKTSSMGYLPTKYYYQRKSMGREDDLRSLISALHDGGTRVLADVVINHAGNKSNWIDFFDQDFGTYGYFKPNSKWITKDDEASTAEGGKYASKLGPNYDDGQNGTDANFAGARDFDHKNDSVQKMCRAYLKFLKYTMNYDGFRFDVAGGYHVSHINDYVTNAKPYFSVMEYWKGDANELKTRIDEAGKNNLAFDFAAKYNVFRDGIFYKSYDKCKNGGLRGKGYSKYAVTFIDNHDTFNRSDNDDVANKRDGSSINDKSLMMRCNAYLLSMPGVPCVFYPHWVKYKSDIKAMINARRMAGIHSESSVQEESGSGFYRATVQGKYGSVKLMLGTAANDAAPAGYTQAVKGTDYAMYYTGTGPQGVENVQTEQKGEKFIENGQLYIRCGEHVFDAQGRKIY